MWTVCCRIHLIVETSALTWYGAKPSGCGGCRQFSGWRRHHREAPRKLDDLTAARRPATLPCQLPPALCRLPPAACCLPPRPKRLANHLQPGAQARRADAGPVCLLDQEGAARGELVPRDAVQHAGLVAAVDETVILLHPPLPLVGVSIVMERERQQNDSLVNGYLVELELQLGGSVGRRVDLRVARGGAIDRLAGSMLVCGPHRRHDEGAVGGSSLPSGARWPKPSQTSSHPDAATPAGRAAAAAGTAPSAPPAPTRSGPFNPCSWGKAASWAAPATAAAAAARHLAVCELVGPSVRTCACIYAHPGRF